jgi:hypothetical protein
VSTSEATSRGPERHTAPPRGLVKVPDVPIYGVLGARLSNYRDDNPWSEDLLDCRVSFFERAPVLAKRSLFGLFMCPSYDLI